MEMINIAPFEIFFCDSFLIEYWLVNKKKNLKAVMYKGNRNMVTVPVPEAAIQYLPQTYTGALPGAWQKPCSPAV